jgi:hypothetical protein
MKLITRLNVKISDFNLQKCNLDEVALIISIESTSAILKSPFNDISFDIPSAYENVEISIRVDSINKKELGRSKVLIKDLLVKNRFELNISLLSPDKLTVESPEIQPEAVGTLKVTIVKQELQIHDLNIHEELFNTFTFSQQTFENMVSVLNQKKASKSAQEKPIGMNFNVNNNVDCSNKMKNIKYLLIGVNEKLKVFDIFYQQYLRLESQVLSQNQTIMKLNQTLQSNLKEFLEYKTKSDIIIQEKNKLYDEVLLKFRNSEGNLSRIVDENKNQRLEIEGLTAQIQKLTEDQDSNERLQTTIKTLQMSNQALEESEKILKTQIKSAQEQYDINYSEQIDHISKLISENIDLAQSCGNFQTKYSDLEFKYKEAITINQKYLSEKKAEQSIETCVRDLEEKCEMFKQSSNKFQQESLSLKDQLDKNSKLFSDYTKEFQKQKSNMSKITKIVTTEKNELNKQLEDLKAQAENAKIHPNQIETTKLIYNDYEKYLNSHKDLVQELKDIEQKNSNFREETLTLLDLAQDQVQNFSQRNLLMHKAQKKINLLYLEKAEEIPTLREMIAQLERNKGLYIPVRGDPIDNCLAKFINSRRSKLEIPFVRLSTGLYLFGSKKVLMKIENADIVSNL